MSLTKISGFNITMKGQMYLFKATISIQASDVAEPIIEDVVIAITGGSVKRSGIIKALTNRCNEIVARRETREKHAKFAGWLLNYSRTISFKQNLASARRKEKDKRGLCVV